MVRVRVRVICSTLENCRGIPIVLGLKPGHACDPKSMHLCYSFLLLSLSINYSYVATLKASLSKQLLPRLTMNSVANPMTSHNTEGVPFQRTSFVRIQKTQQHLTMMHGVCVLCPRGVCRHYAEGGDARCLCSLRVLRQNVVLFEGSILVFDQFRLTRTASPWHRAFLFYFLLFLLCNSLHLLLLASGH
jgi:hypothetical protein